ncbi:MAG: dephospho-CoA kinase, partial [Peptostreptococcales bacterium]
DTIWVIDVDVKTQIERVMERDSATEEEAKSRIYSQLPREERVKWADIVIYNNESLEELKKNIFKHLDNLRKIKRTEGSAHEG